MTRHPILDFIKHRVVGFEVISHLEERAGLPKSTLHRLFYQNKIAPRLDTIEKVLDHLGYELRVYEKKSNPRSARRIEL